MIGLQIISWVFIGGGCIVASFVLRKSGGKTSVADLLSGFGMAALVAAGIGALVMLVLGGK